MTTDNVNESLQLLEAIDPNDEFAYEKAVLAFLKLKKFPVLIYEFSEGLKVFRTRTHQEDNLFELSSDISITPNAFVKSFARCNRPFQSKFYCSENRPTSFMELVQYWVATKAPGERIFVTIGSWIIKKPVRVVIVTTPDKENRISRFDKNHGEALDYYIGNADPEIREGTILLYKYLFDKFRKPAKNDLKTYIITTAYCNLALTQAQGQADGIYYPSVPFASQGVNFALNSEFIKPENIELVDVLRNEMKVEINDQSTLTFTEIGIRDATNVNLKNNSILW